ERPGIGSGASRAPRRVRAAFHRDIQARPGPHVGGGSRPHRRHGGVQHGPVRAIDDPADDRALHPGAGERDGGSGCTDLPDRTADSGRAERARELDRRANSLAHYLGELGVGTESRVGVCLERSLEVPVALLGVLKAGGAYVPLDPAYPAERLAYMASDAGIGVLLTSWGSRQDFSGAIEHEVCLDVEWPAIARHADSNPGVEISGEILAYVIYTSGSTGRPKGAMTTHSGLANYLQWAAETYAAEGCGSVVHSSLSFDLTVTSLWVPLVAGRRVRLLEAEGDADQLDKTLREI